MFTVTKSYMDFPAAHRQPGHDGHCRLIHGHNWGWDITFACDILDRCGFVVDVGKVKYIRRFLEQEFDHTLLLNTDDPLRLEDKSFMEKLEGVYAKVVYVPNCGMEGLAKYVFEKTSTLIAHNLAVDVANRRLRVHEVICWEDSKNRATYHLQ